MPIEWYNHYDRWVAVDTELKGKHVDYCLCYRCTKFLPTAHREDNCRIANVLFAVCCAFNTVTAMWECSEFEEKKREN